ncbi:tumor necrosis factor receptor superfamily member 14-like [Scomber scombrus]|uniref:tumor necrosis factor receptor superfamily member 14-like n=1 Tax=Scomber scombrus TaxID=13677 RepID=UPI002DDC2855|nr:tumor necrosis factor receptor superfamily member 14-like [Scomber scombrus]XP_062283804.1 tumor necrosis factor receptor superfamily member 14-like [Scomber scombrus]
MELMKTANMSYEKSWRRKPLNTVTFLIIMMNVFSVLSLTCHRAEYLIGKECCPKCPPGSRVKTDCTEFRSTSCLFCIDGSFMDEPTGRKQCFPCTNCDSGSGLRIKTSCTTLSNTVCEPLDGFYCTDSDKDNKHNCIAAQKHKSCEPGQYIRLKGTAFTDTECTDCSSDTFSDGTSTSCQSHTKCDSPNLQLIKAGTASTDAECGEKSSNTAVILGPVIGAVGLVTLVIALGIFRFWYKNKKSSQNSEERRNDEDAAKREPLREQGLSSVRTVPGKTVMYSLKHS